MNPLAPFESSIAERYHEETKYSEEGLRREAAQKPQMDWSAQPVPFHRLDADVARERRAGLPRASLKALDEQAHVDLEHAVVADDDALGPVTREHVERARVAAELGAERSGHGGVAEGVEADAISPVRPRVVE